MSNPPFPTSEQFRAWCLQAIKRMRLNYADLMRDETPSSKNRAAAALKAKRVPLDTALRLENEINRLADESQIEIGTWRDYDHLGHPQKSANASKSSEVER